MATLGKANLLALFTADEIMFAGGYVSENGYVTNRSYYLYNNANYWSMTPFYYIASANSAGLFYVNSSGGLSYWRIMNNGGVRPVINLSSDVSLLGSGTSTDPYTVLGV